MAAPVYNPENRQMFVGTAAADQAVCADDLYVMRYSHRHDVVKIGRSSDPEKHRRELEDDHAFRVQLVATFPGRGFLEGRLRFVLASRRNQDGECRDWYNLTVEDALLSIVAFLHVD
jgi:hypothetical protein